MASSLSATTTTTSSSANTNAPFPNNNNSSHHKPSRTLHFLRNRLCAIRQLVRLGYFWRILGVMLLGVIVVHRLLSYSMSHQRLVMAPITDKVVRTCPPPNYATLASASSTTTTTNANNNNKKPKICLTTLTDEKEKAWTTKYLGWRNFDGLLELTWQNKLAYAKRHGYLLFDKSAVLDKSRPPSWSKIRAVQQLLLKQEACDWVFWLDADTVIMDSARRVEDFLPLASNEGDLLVAADNSGGYNAGVWLIRNSAWSLAFLDTWWNMKSYVRPPGLSHSGDNAALKVLLANKKNKQTTDSSSNSNNNAAPSEFDQHVLAPARCTFNSFAKVLPPQQYDHALQTIEQQDWYQSEAYYHKGDFIAHVAGVDNKVDVIQMLLQQAT